MQIDAPDREPAPTKNRNLFIDRRQAQLQTKRLQRGAEGWHEVDRKTTPEQIAQLPAGDPKMGNRSAAVWLEYFHDCLGWVTAKGFYALGTGCWMARYEPQEFRNIVKRVNPVAWAPIQPGVKLCGAPVIPQCLSDPEPEKRRGRRARPC